MERIPEPDLMDDAEQAEAYAEADFSEPHEAFVRHFKTCFPDFLSGELLDLGCGTADVIIRLARVFPGVNITGIDGAQAMLDLRSTYINDQWSAFQAHHINSETRRLHPQRHFLQQLAFTLAL